MFAPANALNVAIFFFLFSVSIANGATLLANLPRNSQKLNVYENAKCRNPQQERISLSGCLARYVCLFVSEICMTYSMEFEMPGRQS